MKKIYNVLFLAVVIMLLFTGCYKNYDKVDLLENKRIYNADRMDSLPILYLTVGQAEDEHGKVWTLEDLNNYVGEELALELPSILREGTVTQDRYLSGYGNQDNTYNSTIELRGDTTKTKPKSFKININDQKELYHMQSKVNLIKFEEDLSRVKTKFYFDLTSYIKDIPGFRTRFVQVKMKDSASNEYVDMGLYSMMEQPNMQYLTAHSMPETNLIYKARIFDFTYDPEVLKPEDDEHYNEDLFEQTISLSEGSTKHKQLIQMVQAVNNYDIDIDETVDTYFSRDNLLSFTALNILLENTDVINRNYMLMYRKEDKKWFLTAWDCENILSSVYQKQKFPIPDSLYSYDLFEKNLLYRRFYAKKENIDQLTERLAFLYRTLMPKVDLLEDNYINLIYSQMIKEPDINMLPSTVDLVDDYIYSFDSIIENNYNRYQKALTLPYSFDLTNIQSNGNQIDIAWDRGLNDAQTGYRIYLAKDPQFTNIVQQVDLSPVLTYTFKELPPYEYYIKVCAVNVQGEQLSHSVYTDPFSKVYYGVDKVVVTP